ncbi:histidinol dehydrogenase [Candidatus Bathyarchaeota archaeon]|nr:histidinol dehydrogenase [Candidatus Bathyarchaeota archaeon]MBL7079319.1 histidinol dehydrogenase [Candidatus Bathyarchaeota archaeon]
MMKRYYETPEELLKKRWPDIEATDPQLRLYVEPIVEDVRIRGDEAVKEYTQKFDGVATDELRVRPEEIRDAYSAVTEGQVEALKELKKRLESVESKRLSLLSFTIQIEDVGIECTVRPLRSVGCYVPGGKAAYPSSLLMNVVPAKVAGVEKIIVCTPPGRDGSPSPLTLVASDICGVDAVYKAGGAQAISAMAYGTETIPRVDKIVGPGNRYVTAAKQVVSNVVSIDKPAGPSEILVLADGTADPKLIALDLISQAEHGEGGAYGLVTTSTALADEVDEALVEILSGLPDGEAVGDLLAQGGFTYIVESIDEAVEFANLYAPEHLEILTEDPSGVAEKVTSAGLVLLGAYSPVSATDYGMGVNHVLPTGGYGKVASGITVLDYLRTVSVVESSVNGLAGVRGNVKALSEAEGLPNHSLAVEGRFN